MASLLPRGGPYAPTTQASGEVPYLIPDVPISISLLAAYLVLGASHMALLQRNKKRGHHFPINGACFGLCFVRTVTFSLRTAWALHPYNVALGLASTLFVYAGTIILFLAQLVFTLRIVRVQLPRLGWSRPAFAFLLFCCLGIGLTLVMVISAVVDDFMTLSTYAHDVDRAFELYALTFYLAMAFLPLPILAASTLARRVSDHRARPARLALVLASAAILSLGAGYRAGITWQTPTSLEVAAQPWYLTKAAFYTFNFATELVVLAAWLAARVDQRFHVPDGAKGGYHVGADGRDSSRAASSTGGGSTLVADEGSEAGDLPHVVYFNAISGDDWFGRFDARSICAESSTSHVNWEELPGLTGEKDGLTEEKDGSSDEKESV